jgi:hypothetical protein
MFTLGAQPISRRGLIAALGVAAVGATTRAEVIMEIARRGAFVGSIA